MGQSNFEKWHQNKHYTLFDILGDVLVFLLHMDVIIQGNMPNFRKCATMMQRTQ